MIKQILKMGGCKTPEEFYKKYPTEESFIEAFPQAVKFFKKGGEQTPPTAAEFFSYGAPTPDIPMLFKHGGESTPPTAEEFFSYGHPTPEIPMLMEEGGSIPMNTKETFVQDKLKKFTHKLKTNAVKAQFEKGVENLLGSHGLMKKGGKILPKYQYGDEFIGPVDPNGMSIDPNYRAPRIDTYGNRIPVQPASTQKYSRSFNVQGPLFAEGMMLPFNMLNKSMEASQNRIRDFKRLDNTLADSMFPSTNESDDQGDWDQFGNFRPNRLSTPIAKSGMEVQGPNTSFFPWPGHEGNYSEPDLAVNKTLTAVPEEEANVEAEHGETVVAPLNGDGIPEQYKISGKKHYDGGVPLNLPDHSYIFSDHLKLKDPELLKEFGITSKKRGVTFADIAKRYDLNKFKQKLLDKETDDLEKSTAEQMLANYNQKLGKVALLQESMKGFEEGVPLIAQNYLEGLGARPEDLGMAEQPAANMTVAQDGKEIRYKTDPFYAAKYYAGKVNDFINPGEPGPKPWTGDTRRMEETPEHLARKDKAKAERREILRNINITNAAERQKRYEERNPYYGHTLDQIVTFPKRAIDAAASGIARGIKGGADAFYGGIESLNQAIYDAHEAAQTNVDYVEKGYEGLTPRQKAIFDANKTTAAKPKKVGVAVGAPAVNEIGPAVGGEDNPIIEPDTVPAYVPPVQQQQPAQQAAPVSKPKPAPRKLPGTKVIKTAEDSAANDIPEGYVTDYKQGGSVRKYQGGGAYTQYPKRSRIPKSDEYDILAPNMSVTGFSTQPFDPNLGYYSAVDEQGNTLPLDIDNFIKRQKDVISNYTGGVDAWKQDVISKDLKTRKKATGYFQKSYDDWRTKEGLDPYFYGQASSDPYGYDEKFGVYTWSAPGLRRKEQQAATPQPAPAGLPPIQPGDPLNPVAQGKGFAPWWTQDIINSGAAMSNLAGIKKYYPWEGMAGFDEADPTFLSPERQLAANAEQLNIGAQTASQFTNPQAFAANFSNMSGQTAKNAADILGNVNNQNIGIANQFEMGNTGSKNEYMKYLADRATRLYDKGTITDQQYDNAKRQGFDQLRESINTGLTNAGQTDTVNKLSKYYATDPITGRTYQKYAKPMVPDPSTSRDFLDDISKLEKLAMIDPKAAEGLAKIYAMKWNPKMAEYASSQGNDDLIDMLRARGIL